MPFNRPTLAQLVERTEADLAARLGLGALVPRGVLVSLARTHAGMLHGLYGFQEWASRQGLPDTADTEGLERWANDLGVPRKPATFAGGEVEFTGTTNADVPLGTVVTRADGARFVTLADAVLSAGAAVVEVQAELAGVLANSPAATELALVSPLAGVNSTATVEAAGLTGGADVESDADLLVRVLQRMQNPPHGGSASDYVRWALEVPGVTRAWCLPEHFGIGTVGVAFVTDDDPAGLIPGAPKVAEVQAYIDDRRPVPATVTVFAPVAVPVNFTFTAITPDTAAVRTAIEVALADLILREGAPGAPVLLSHVREAISTAPGEQDFTLTVPAANVTIAAGQIPTFGVVTWP